MMGTGEVHAQDWGEAPVLYAYEGRESEKPLGIHSLC